MRILGAIKKIKKGKAAHRQQIQPLRKQSKKYLHWDKAINRNTPLSGKRVSTNARRRLSKLSTTDF
jgi:hypothetical protein